ncbi:double-strand-break repair protein rad21-like protein 1 [Zeugodacus cucurbitae]|uniref:Double-strand-break repair protein rad21 homolog n=1 Tax=Zeugodacus cucurbitae TaxID=28588 RepID=A0A0A1WWZ5_ZEUCU|nr:double-strand-break repair protein rad21-like protein 1 [Zeugodacus cucurbitae]
MFYAHLILAKKGPLARVWLAAHWDKKITKAHVFETNIEKSVEGIMQPKVKLALRTSGHLLLGVVRIYSRKAKYLLADCNEAFVKIKMAFRPGMVDLPEGHREANVNAITLPEVFHDFDTALPELNDIDIEAQFAINQSRADEITMREDYGGSLSLSIHDDGFGDMGFEGDTPDLIRGPIDANIDDQLFGDGGMADVTLVDEPKITLNDTDLGNSRLDGDGFGDEFGQPELFEDDLFAEPPLDSSDNNLKAAIGAAQESDDEGMDHMDIRPPSVASSCDHASEINEVEKEALKDDGIEALGNLKEDENQLDQSTLLQNEDESFALAPIDASAYKGVTKAKRKRKLIVDEVKNISGEEMKAQLANTTDIVTTLDLAPPTKRLTYWKETGGVEKLFSLPSRTIPARTLFLNYQRHLVSRNSALEDFSILGPSDLLAIEHIQNENDANVINNKRGRKRKHDLQPVQQILADVTAQSLAAPEAVRDLEQSVGQAQFSLGDNLIPPAENSLFDNMRSPSRMLSMNEINGMENLTSLNDLPLTPSNLHHGLDASDDFNHGDATPAGLHHGDQTPHHSSIEHIDHLPNLPADQVSSILQEAENIPNIQTDVQTSKAQRTSDISTDWNDYDLPPPPPNPAEEQLENETDEQFEERVLNKRAAQLFYTVKSRLIKQDCLILSALTVNNTRKQAAQKFYSLLVLKKFRALNIEQTQPYADIEISRGPLFENPKL